MARGSNSSYVALLRGINVAGKNKLAMADLCEMFVAAGASDVQSYIQSGNVVFKAPVRLAERMPELITRAIKKATRYDVPVVLRSAAELGLVLACNPFLKSKKVESLHMMFLADRPSPKAVAGLDPNRSAGDEFKVIGRDVYLCLPNGVGKTKLSNAYFDSRLSTVSTIRNWRTVQKLLELAEG